MYEYTINSYVDPVGNDIRVSYVFHVQHKYGTVDEYHIDFGTQGDGIYAYINGKFYSYEHREFKDLHLKAS